MYLQEKLCAGQTLEGPAIIIDKNRCECVCCTRVCVCVFGVCVYACVRMLAWMCVPVYNGVQLRTVAIS